jgi:hypothetical protein
MDMYCSIDDAFNGPMLPPGATTMKKKKKTKESMVGTQVPGEPDRFAEKPPPSNDVLESPQAAPHLLSKPLAHSTDDSYFPLPGDTATPEAWQKAFMLEPDWTKLQNVQDPAYLPDGTIKVDGQSTLWKQIPSYTPTSHPKTVEDPFKRYPDIQKRLDEITQQMEALSIPSHLQSTAELFLFVAIGLVLLLAIDILLKYATVMALRSNPMKGGYRGIMRGKSRL